MVEGDRDGARSDGNMTVAGRPSQAAFVRERIWKRCKRCGEMRRVGVGDDCTS
jgi:hypothetical protein